MAKQQWKGVLLSYSNAALNVLSSLILVPMLISSLSEETYSLYKVIQSFAGSLMMFNLGLSTVAARAVARCSVLSMAETRREKENTLALTGILSLAMGVVILLLGRVMTALLPILFGNIYSPQQLDTAAKLVAIFSAATALHILSDTFRGRILGREHYLVSQGTMTGFHILRFCAMAVIARRSADVCALAMVDLLLYAMLLAVHFSYSRFVLKEKGKLTSLKKEAIVPIAVFASAIVLQALVTQASTNLDTVILGAAGISPRTITMYASSLTIYTVYRSLTGILSGIYLPNASRLTATDSNSQKLTDFVTAPGRIQAVIALGILSGFALLGRDFIRLWIGPEYLDAWPLTLALMAAATIPLTQSTCVTLLDAKLKRLPRSLVLLVMALINAVLSVLLVKPLGYWGPALGTILSLLLGEGLLMNLHYKKSLGLEIRRMFREIFSGTLAGALVSTLVCLPLAWLQADDFYTLAGKGLLFLTAYLAAIWQFAGFRQKGGTHERN